jgi:hypothetical protein
MIKPKKSICFFVILVFVGILAISFVSSIENYDQRVYKVNSNSYTEKSTYSQNYCPYCDSQRDYVKKPSVQSQDYYKKIHYTHYGYEDTRKSFWGDYVKEYTTQVTNCGNTGRYFTVVFTLKDKHGYEFTQSVTQYLRMGEKKKFVYRDIQYERNEILRWDYKIIPQKY